MSTRSSVRNLFPPLDNLEITIRRRPRVDPTLLNDFEIGTDGNGDPPVPDHRTMEELCQPTLNGRGGPIASISIQATDFGLKNDMFQQVQNSCQFHGLPGDDSNKHLDKFLHVTQSIKVNGVTDDALRLYLFPHSLTHYATARFDRLPRNSINTFEQMAKMFLGEYFPPSMLTKLRNEITNFRQRIKETIMEFLRGTTKEETNSSKELFMANDAILKNMQTNMTSLTNSNLELKNMFGQFIKMNTVSSSGSGTLPSNTITNPKEDLKGITTPSGNAYKGPTIPTTSSLPKVVERKTEVTKDTVPPTNNGSPKDVQPPVVQIETPIPNSEPVVALVAEPLLLLFADALILMPKFGPTIKSLLTNKEKLFELSRTPLNEHCSTALLKKLPEKLGDPVKFLIPCDFPGMDECLALADLDASINLMPLFVWNKLSLPEQSPTCMTLELVDHSISRPDGVAEDVFVKTGRALIDVYEGELTLRVGKEAPISSKIDDRYYDSEGGILLLEEFLNDDPSSPPLPPQELKVVKSTNEKSSIDQPPVVELKDLPPHLQYAFLEGDDKLPVIIAKDMKDEEKAILIKVLKSHKQALAWQLSDIKGINSKFCTHKILMEDDFKPAVQHQRRVNPKIHEVIKRRPQDQEKTTFTYPYRTFAYRRMPFGLCNAPGTFRRCMTAIFYDMIEKMMKVFMDDFSVFGNSFETCLSHLDKTLKRCEDTNLCLNWEKGHFMVKEDIILSHKISKNMIEVDKAKVDVIAKLPHPTTVKGIRSFLGHAGFYRRFIQDFSKIARPMTRLLEKDTPFFFSKECVESFQTLKRKLTEAPILVAPD
nr:hypothetical protein [Tanacetum cinerariifolium]